MKVTVYIPTKNRLSLLQRAIDSVASQSYPDVEILVVDDGSSDGTRSFLIEAQKSNLLRAVFHEKSLGACASRNTAIQAASGYFVTGLDDDDYFLSRDRIHRFVEKWGECGDNVVGLFDSVIALTRYGSVKRHTSAVVSHNQLRRLNLIGSQVFAPRINYVKAGLFDTRMPAWQDWEMWHRMSRGGGVFVNLNMASYLVDESHHYHRVTQKSEESIRYAMNLLKSKIDNITFIESSYLLASLYLYPQISPRFNELLSLLTAGRILTLLRVIKRLA